MSDSMLVMTLPPGEKEQLTCETCGGTDFHLFGEKWNGAIEIFHTACTGCGKRGALTVHVETSTSHKFTQFADPPPGSAGGPFVVTMTTSVDPTSRK